MIAPPVFGSVQEFVSGLGDAGFWRPYVLEILRRHDLADVDLQVVEGFNATHPTFLCGDVVVKLFGCYERWREAYAAEHAAQSLIATDPGIRAPRLLGAGHLFGDDDASWPYLITARMPGKPWARGDLTPGQRRSIVAELGRQAKRVHALPRGRVVTDAYWRPATVAAANVRSSLPPHLVAQIDGFLQRLAPFDRVVVHGDLVANHVFVDDGNLAGIIDWGDAMYADRHAELIQPHRDLFDCDKELLSIFLDASDWPVGKDFARQALGLALHRQAIGLAQHHSMDVFEPIAARFSLDDIETLDDLALQLFAL